MGDRANIKLQEQTGMSIYVYTHWLGSEFPVMLREALSQCRDRWTDEPYLHQFLITQLCKPAGQETTGFGVSTYRTDNEHDVFEVNSSKQQVRQLSREGWHDQKKEWESLPPKVLRTWTFEDFVTLADRELC